ncbi:hypothetical protein DBR36_06560 [Microbacterium sp. HMWF026]|uniref:hypothetical protein n=1 Tax=Microbacterium sp. HMWF026 TaxID=2056861 RepID=UPI000D3533B3|nr:hypothetical protein [Microbacterium sp. HMWF026]PTT20062.1 hypothetical protein DBR36_06560 [Microbacterium sp. HMWF026]
MTTDVAGRVKWLSNQLQPRVNLARARTNALVEDISRWRKPEPMKSSLHLKDAPECGWYIEVESVDPPPRVEEWGIQLGEVAHHLRSLLNTTLTRIVKREGEEPAKSLQYPITLTPAQWRDAKKRKQMKGLPERVVRAIYACQPFVMARTTGYEPRRDVLAVLAWLNNQDKHRLEIGGEFGARWVAYEGRIITANGESKMVRPRLTYDWSLEPGSRLVDADTSPDVVVGFGRTTLDLHLDVLVPDELGHTTVLEQLLEEIWGAYQQAQMGLLFAWADEGTDLDKLAGATDFKAGGAFGKAAVDSTYGAGVWDKDVLRRQEELAEREAGRAEPSPPFVAPDVEPSGEDEVQWESLRGLIDVHRPPRTWRGTD